MDLSDLQQVNKGASLYVGTKKKSHWKYIFQYKYLYLLLLPAIVFYIIFSYVPMYGIQLAFKDFNYSKGIMASPWVEFHHFGKMFSQTGFWTAFSNTIIIALQRLVIEFPFPIFVALLLNEVGKQRVKRLYQTVYTFPHFLSWVVASGIMVNLFSSEGAFNQLITALGMNETSFLTDPSAFRWLLYGTSIWKDMGWNTIIYLATIASIDPQLYESAVIDGANRWQQMKAITWPYLKNTTAILFILAVGGIMSSGGGGFDQIFNMYNPAVYDVSDIVDTYIYRITFIESANYGYSTAVGLFKSVINAALLFGANYVSKLLGQDGIL